MTAGASLRRKHGEQRVRGVPTGAAGGHLSRCTLAYRFPEEDAKFLAVAVPRVISGTDVSPLFMLLTD